MLTELFQARLEALNRERLPPAQSAAAARAPHAHCELPADLSLATLAPGELIETPHGPHYSVARLLCDFWPEVARPVERAAADRPGVDPAAHPARAAFTAEFPRRTLFLDLETCGFAGSPIFLIGLVRLGEDGLVLEQLLARDYSEEVAILATLWHRAADCRVLITFNGKSFDWPMVHDRTTFHRLDRSAAAGGGHVAKPDLVHFDLLHHARRRWRKFLPDCRLQTLERYVCRRTRQDDLPGARIPGEYHHFVRSGDARQIRAVLLHNALDLVTLVQLALRLGG